MYTEKIMLRGEGIREEAVTAAETTPGWLVEIDSNGKVAAHGTAGGTVAPVGVALNDYLQGESVETTIDAGEICQFNLVRSGDVVNMLIESGTNYSINTRLESAGDGALRAEVTGTSASDAPQRIVGKLISALDLSATGAVDTRAPVLIA